MAIDFTLSKPQQELQAGARAFAAGTLGKVASVISPLSRPEQRFYATRPFYQAMADAGFIKAILPTEFGGTALSVVDLALATEELAAVDINVPTALVATGLGLEPLMRFGTLTQKKRFLPDFIEDGSRLAAFAFTEVAGGANFDCPDPAAGVQTFARREGDEWVINGRKHYTTNGSGWDGNGAHLFSVVCRTDPSRSPQDALAVIVVPGNAAGIRVDGLLDTVGHRAANSPRIIFENVRVPVDNIIGKPGDGIGIVETTFSWSAALIGAACVGVMRSAFDTALQFAKTDKRLGTSPVIEHQSVGYMLADIKMRIEAARYLTWKACHQLDVTDGRSQELAVMAKVHCSELCVQVVYDAMRVVGVNSYTDMFPLAGLMQDALCFPLYDGGNMGVRRRQLHAMLRSSTYDAMASAEGRG
ncbi:acyl-CoA dehydrogenase family protein [Bradyrhizobium sp. AUGA SZCCT0176]|uniref:acyl-CoA dehydrogenase family protein n=1 Tax=unclassified Bradyrhizobium TaxID=2631580 RepID=UPI001BA8981F|nr:MULTISPECIES: acyl-CoA dehydrogenase family protein [unclassified Bradyrhizobium]MBR1225154.1 acyl-CoA dehydrogenase family protein [Bradyrhizobium sp. AUGA SZCCT0176]MBR1281245.1 acyl-CoA dehydrogenase family protein [Bradyrhizobium sp. AUGA SZCCT0177]